MSAVRRALRHAGHVQGWPRAQVLGRRPRPDGTVVVVLRARAPLRRVSVTYGIRVGRRRVLEDDVRIKNPPEPDRSAEVRTQ